MIRNIYIPAPNCEMDPIIIMLVTPSLLLDPFLARSQTVFENVFEYYHPFFSNSMFGALRNGDSDARMPRKEEVCPVG